MNMINRQDVINEIRKEIHHIQNSEYIEASDNIIEELENVINIVRGIGR